MAESRVFFFSSSSSRSEPDWRPAVDIYHHRQGWLIKCDLAGVRRDELQITVMDTRLRISGVRRDCSIVEGQRAYSLEIAYNRFAREIELPCDLMHASLQIDYRDGMLLIDIATEDAEETS